MIKKIPCILLAAITAAAMIYLFWALHLSALLPVKLMVGIAVLFCLLLSAVVYLTWDHKRLIRFLLGTVLALGLTIGMVVGGRMVYTAVETMNRIINTNANYSHVGVYVKKEDSAQSLADAKDYTFGILAAQDAENTAAALGHVEEALGHGVSTCEYSGLLSLMRAFFDGECKAVVLNREFMTIVSELEGMEDVSDWTRELTIMKVEVTEPSTEPTTMPSEPVEETTRPEETIPEPVYTPEVFTMYFSGNDGYGEVNERGRSDSNILAVVNTGTGQILLITTPRDYYITLPFEDFPKDKLTHASIYGLDRSISILSDLYDVDIDYYFRVNFSGFQNIVDALGGITVHSDVAFQSFADKDFYFHVGENEVDGLEALVFARDRYSHAEGDGQRAKHQMEVIRGVIRKACSPAILTRYSELLEAVEGSFLTNIPYEKITELVRMQLDEPRDWEFITVSAGGNGNSRYCYAMGTEAYVVDPDYDSVNQIRDMVKTMYSGGRIEQEK